MSRFAIKVRFICVVESFLRAKAATAFSAS